MRGSIEGTYTRRWFLRRNYQTFELHVAPTWRGRPVTYLELGVFEGMSLAWMLKNVLTHPDARAVGVDPWLETTKMSAEDMEQVRLRATGNLEPWTSTGKCMLYRANSAEILRKMLGRRGKQYPGFGPGSIDLCMVDGNHWSLAVLDDARIVYQLLRPGGWMLFDDVENRVVKPDHVKEGLGMFLAEVGPKVRLLTKHRYMELYEKVE